MANEIGKKTFLASVFDAIVNERLEYLQKVSYLAYVGLLLFYAYNLPYLFTGQDWGTLDAKPFVIISTAFFLLWGRFVARMEVKAAREALHFGTERQFDFMQSIFHKLQEKPQTVINVDADGEPDKKKTPDFEYVRPSNEDRELTAEEYELGQPEKNFARFFTNNLKPSKRKK